jgi:hypothetical protein
MLVITASCQKWNYSSTAGIRLQNIHDQPDKLSTEFLFMINEFILHISPEIIQMKNEFQNVISDTIDNDVALIFCLNQIMMAQCLELRRGCKNISSCYWYFLFI